MNAGHLIYDQARKIGEPTAILEGHPGDALNFVLALGEGEYAVWLSITSSVGEPPTIIVRGYHGDASAAAVIDLPALDENVRAFTFG